METDDTQGQLTLGYGTTIQNVEPGAERRARTTGRGSARWESGTIMDRAWNRTSERVSGRGGDSCRGTGAGAADDTQGQLALGVWYTMEQDDERAEQGRLVAEWVLERGAWDDTQRQLGV